MTTNKPSTQPQKNDVLIESKFGYHFFDSDGMQNHQQSILFQSFIENQGKISRSLEILKKTKSLSFPLEYATFNNKLFRVVPPKNTTPLNTAATFGAGGRLNIGMAQMHQDFPSLKASHGLYCSLDIKTAIKEYNSPIPAKKWQEIEIEADKESIKLINLDALVLALEEVLDELLYDEYQQTPFEARWALQKFPLPPQIIAEIARNQADKNTDGFYFKSTKGEGTNCFVFDPSSYQIIKSTTCQR